MEVEGLKPRREPGLSTPLWTTGPTVLATLAAEPQRWPRTRTGERDPIPPLLRRLVYERDGYACGHCGSPYDLQLDHLVPWSADGDDRSSNLRTLCAPCNQDRSNWVDPFPPRVVPVTAWCDWCHLDQPHPTAIKAYCGHCGTVSWTDPRRTL